MEETNREMTPVEQMEPLKTEEPINLERKITFNAMGSKHVLTFDKLKKFGENSRIGKLQKFDDLTPKEIMKLCDGFDPVTLEFFFNRDPDVLKIILNYAITGEVHMNSSLCECFLEKEFKYWMLDLKKVKRCCRTTFESNLEEKSEEIKTEQEIIKELKVAENKVVGTAEELWNVVDDPRSSTAATVYCIATNLFLLSWLIIFIYQTMPEVRATMEPSKPGPESDLSSNTTTVATTTTSYIKMSGKQLGLLFMIVDLIAFSIFLIDALFRLIVCPHKLEWIKNPLNIIDLATVILFFIIFIILQATQSPIANTLRKIIESFRVVLFLKLTRITWRFQTVGKTLRRSYRELVLAVFFIVLSILVISTAMFYCEVGTNSDGGFSSIPATFWWSIVTMTTVGYGDMYPITTMGKLIAGLTAIWGIVLIALPVAVIGSNFTVIYQDEEKVNKLMQEHKKQAEEKKVNNKVEDDAKYMKMKEDTKIMMTNVEHNDDQIENGILNDDEQIENGVLNEGFNENE